MAKMRMKKWAGKLAVFLVWMIIWEMIYLAVGQEILVVSPLGVAARLFHLIGQQSFWQSVGLSMLRILAGFALGMAVGALLAVLTSFSKMANAFLRPVLGIVKATPVASFIILALVWIATGGVPIFISFLMVLPVVWGNVSEGIERTDRGLLEMARVFRLSRGKRAARIYLPSVMPYFLAAARTAMGLAWKAGIAAEVLCRPELSIGRALYNAKIYLETPDLFAWTTVVILLSILLEKGMLRLFAYAGARYNAKGEGYGNRV